MLQHYGPTTRGSAMGERYPTLAFMMKGKIDFDKIDSLSFHTLRMIEEIVTDASLGDAVINTLSTKFRGLVIIRIDENGEIKSTCSEGNNLSDEDKQRIFDWLHEEKHTEYSEEYFRLDLSKYILMFKAYSLDTGKALIGYILDNNSLVKVELLQARQQYLMRTFL